MKSGSGGYAVQATATHPALCIRADRSRGMTERALQVISMIPLRIANGALERLQFSAPGRTGRITCSVTMPGTLCLTRGDVVATSDWS